MTSAFAQVPDGYEILPLEVKHLPWVAAIVGQTMALDSPILTSAFPHDQTQRAYDAARAIRPSSEHCIKSGLSFGVFVKNWKPRFPDTQAGDTKEARRVHWDTANPSATREELLEQMDSPLVSIAMHKDATNNEYDKPKDHKTFGEVMGKPHQALRAGLKLRDSPKAHEAKTLVLHGQVLKNSGIHTRGDHAGKGLSKALAHHVMTTVAEKGYYRIELVTGNEAVNRVWENPPAPFKATVVAALETIHMIDVFGGADVKCKNIWVILKEGGEKI
jgi:hypothetical protein